MYRSLLVCGALCCLPACQLSPNTPALLQTPVTGDWSGTFESSWGVLPMRATLKNEPGGQSISGAFAIDGQRASGTVSGTLETKSKDGPAFFWGSLTISYPASSGEMCRSTSNFNTTVGSATERSASFVTEGFTSGNCPDPPMNVRIALRR